MAILRENKMADFAISSAKVQSNICGEIIISDNNENRSQEVIDDWCSDLRVKYVNSGCNIGMFRNYVRAYDNSNNQYFCWLSDDDFIHPMFSEVVATEITRDTNNDTVAWVGLSTVHSKNYCSRLTGRIFPSIISPKRIDRLRDVAYFGQWNYPFYSVIDKNKISIETLRKFCEWPAPDDGLDWAWTYALALRGKIKVIPEQMYFYDISNWQNGSGKSKQLKQFKKAIKNEFCGNEELIEKLTVLNRFLLYMTFTLSDYIDYVDSDNTAYSAQDVNDMIKLWCHDMVGELIKMKPLNETCSEKYFHFLKSRNIRDFIYRLSDIYDQYLINPSVCMFLRKIYASEVCIDKMNVMNTAIKKPKQKNFSISNIQTKGFRLLMHFWIHIMIDKIVFLPRSSK